jgi:hypothetical protein
MKRKKAVESEQYCCPLCAKPLTQQNGTSIHPNDPKFGIVLYCSTPVGNGPEKCPAQECSGHGKTIEEAFDVIIDKFTKTRSGAVVE